MGNFELECVICNIIADEYAYTLEANGQQDNAMSDHAANCIMEVLIAIGVLSSFDDPRAIADYRVLKNYNNQSTPFVDAADLLAAQAAKKP